MASVSLNSVTKIYDNEIIALDRMSLEVADGELMVILGPSGCGKTTTLRMIAGLERPSSGSIVIGDRMANDIAPKDRGVAMVFQNCALYSHLNVFQNMAFSLKFGKCSRADIEARVREVARILGVEGLLGRKPADLSGGQRQRVALGRAMVQKPAVFLFDEPLSNLDPQSRTSARRELKALHHRLGTTTVYVTHDQGEAMTLGDRIAVMLDGTIRQIGAPLELFNAPADRFVASFIGTPPMNFLEGEIKVREDAVTFEMPGAEVVLPEELAKQMGTADGESMVLGIRPRDLRYTTAADGEENVLLGTVDAIETPGDRLDAHITTRSCMKLVASLDSSSRITVGHSVELTLDAKGIKIFETGTCGRNVASRNAR